MIYSALTVLIATTTGSSMSPQHSFPSQFSSSSFYGAELVLHHLNFMLLYGFVNFSQNIAFPVNVRVLLAAVTNHQSIGTLAQTLAALYGVWNLDFFRTLIPHICLEVNTLQALALDYATACYPLLLILVSYVLIELHAHNFRLLVYLWKPFRRFFIYFQKQWNIKTSVIEVFATFLFLSNVKFLSVSFDLLAPTEVRNINGSLLGIFL